MPRASGIEAGLEGGVVLEGRGGEDGRGSRGVAARISSAISGVISSVGSGVDGGGGVGGRSGGVGLGGGVVGEAGGDEQGEEDGGEAQPGAGEEGHGCAWAIEVGLRRV